jgi:integrase
MSVSRMSRTNRPVSPTGSGFSSREIIDAGQDHMARSTCPTWIRSSVLSAFAGGGGPTAALAQQLLVYLDGRTRGPLFTSTGGTRFSVRRIRSVLHGAPQRAGIHPKTMSLHTVRSTWATLAWNAGMPIETVPALMGHAGPRLFRGCSAVTVYTARADYERAMSAIVAAPDGGALMGAHHAG